MDLMALVARLTLDKSNYDQGLDDASKGAKSFGDKLKSGLGTAAKVGAAAVTAVATAAGAMTTALVKGAGEVAAYGDNIDKASQKLGISAEAYQEWDAVLQHSGTSIDSLGIGMKTLASKAQSGSDAFTKLGISQKAAASMSREELFSKTITALQNVTDENERSALATELFGRSAMELGPLLNTSAADTQAMKDRVHELGGVMSNEAVKAAAAYQDSLQDMTTAFDGLKRNLMSEFLPSLTTVMDGLTELFTTGGTEKISEGINAFVDKIGEVIPKILEKGSEIVLALAKAIVDNLPKLINAAVQAILTFAQGIVKELPTLVKAGLQIILELARSIAKALPELIPTIVEVVMEIVDVLTDPNTLSNLVDAAIEIIIALADGLIEAVPKLIERAPKIVLNLVTALIANAPKLAVAALRLMQALGNGIINSVGAVLSAVGQIGVAITEAIGNLVSAAWNWGKDLILNFWEGLKAFISYPIRAVQDLAAKIKGFLGFSEPEEGPLSNFHTYAPDMMALFAKGITDNERLITDAIDDAFNIQPNITQNVSAAGTGQEIVVERNTSDGKQSAVMMVDRTVFARLIYTLYNEQANKVGVQLAGVNI